MVGVIDIGNSMVHYGIYKEEKLLFARSYSHSARGPVTPIVKALQGRKLNGIALSSVVPGLTKTVVRMIRRHIGLRPFIVTHKVRSSLTMAYHRPETLGTDRIVNVVAALARYKGNIIVVDFGTAITIDIATQSRNYLGGIILPGTKATLCALTESTALLKAVSFRRPEQLIGRSTEECIRSGIFYGMVHAVDGLIRGIGQTTKKKFTCIATGGWGRAVSRYCTRIDGYDKDLTLYGLLKVYQLNVS